MKLYELRRGDMFTLKNHPVKIPPGAMAINEDAIMTFQNVDGMYSYCTDNYGNVYHPAAWSEVDPV